MKIKPENITGVTAKFFHPDDRAPYPVSWRVNVSPRSESRTFESYGKNAMDYEYPIEKLPKAVQDVSRILRRKAALVAAFFVENYQQRKWHTFVLVVQRLFCEKCRYVSKYKGKKENIFQKYSSL